VCGLSAPTSHHSTSQDTCSSAFTLPYPPVGSDAFSCQCLLSRFPRVSDSGVLIVTWAFLPLYAPVLGSIQPPRRGKSDPSLSEFEARNPLTSGWFPMIAGPNIKPSNFLCHSTSMRRAYQGSFFPIRDHFFPHPVAAPSTEILASRPLYLPATDARRRRMIMGHKESVGQSGEWLGIFAIRAVTRDKRRVG
jgi:hypothetical protein